MGIIYEWIGPTVECGRLYGPWHKTWTGPTVDLIYDSLLEDHITHTYIHIYNYTHDTIQYSCNKFTNKTKVIDYQSMK